MIRINLLPIKEIRQKLRLRQEVFAFAASFLGVLVILGIISLGMIQKVGALQKDIQALETKRKNYDKILKEIDQLQKDKKLLETKLQTIEQLKSESQISVRVLDEIANRTPTSTMWLTSLKLSGNSLQLAGVALDNATIAQYMRALEASDYFGPAELANASQTVIGNQKLKSFALTLSITPPVLSSVEAPKP